MRVAQFVPVDEQGLCDGELDLVGRLDEVLDRVLQVVRRVDHVAHLGHYAVAVFEELEHDEEELVRLDGSDGEVVVAVLRVVEVEAAEPTDHGEAAHDLLDVGAGKVVSEVDEALGVVARGLREQE